jgi:hypothetical protein
MTGTNRRDRSAGGRSEADVDSDEHIPDRVVGASLSGDIFVGGGGR